MPVDPAPLIDRHQCSRQTALGRPLPHHLLSILRLRPDMGEAEKVERRCLAVWMRATLALGAEVDEARLVRMEREPVPIKPLSQHFQNPFGVVVALERHHEVISKPHQGTWSRHAGLHHVLEPLVQHMVQEDGGVPLVPKCRSPFSSTPALSHLSIIRRITPSVTRWSRKARSLSWGMESKEEATHYPSPRHFPISDDNTRAA